MGTPFYMSPEQAQAFPDVDDRTDIYSVGAILYECLTGMPPHSGKSYEQVIVSICMKDPPDVRTHNPAVPDDLAEIIAKALAREREDRFPDARSFLNALVDAAPEQLKQLTPSSQLRRISARPGSIGGSGAGGLDSDARATPRIISGEHDASGLADTVADSGGSGIGDSGSSVGGDSGVSTVAASTIRSPALEPGGKSRWMMPVVAAGLVLLGAVLYLSLGNKPDANLTTPSAERPSSQAAAVQPSSKLAAPPLASAAPSSAASETASRSQDDTASTSSLPSKPKQPHGNGPVAKNGPAVSSPGATESAAPKTATPAAPQPSNTGGLEILTR